MGVDVADIDLVINIGMIDCYNMSVMHWPHQAFLRTRGKSPNSQVAVAGTGDRQPVSL